MATLNEVLTLLDRDPDCASALERILQYEDDAIAALAGHELTEWEHLGPNGLLSHDGVEPAALGVTKLWMNRLVLPGICELVYRSSNHSPYRLADRELVRRALQAWKPSEEMPAQREAEIPGDLFDVVTGHDDIKRVLTLSLLAPRPVHVLLSGPPATAKSLFLEELKRLEGACYADGALATRAGIVEVLLRDQPRYLLIDQVDHLPPDDQQGLLGLMATGRVARMHRYDTRDEMRLCWVFGTANEPQKLSRPLYDRFQNMPVHEYTEEQFENVCRRFLVKREGVDQELAAHIARQLAPSGSIRGAQRLARLARSVADVEELLGILSFPVEYATPVRRR